MVCELESIKLLLNLMQKIAPLSRNMILKQINYKVFTEWLWVSLFFVNKIMLKMQF